MVEWRDDVSMVIDPIVPPKYPIHVLGWVAGDLCTVLMHGGGGVLPSEPDDDLLTLKYQNAH